MFICENNENIYANLLICNCLLAKIGKLKVKV